MDPVGYFQRKLCAARALRGSIARFVKGGGMAECRRLEQELQIAAIAFEAQMAMLITDSEERILRANRAFSELTGYTPEELIGFTQTLLQCSCDEPAHAAAWEKIRSDGHWRGETRGGRKNGDTFPISLSVTAVRDDTGKLTNYVLTMTDITQRKAAEKEIEQLAYYDALTKLGNRRMMVAQLQDALSRAAFNDSRGALFFIDLDNFKSLNDMAGHEVGDQLLQQVAARLLACAGASGHVVRLGGDEFVVILADLDPQEQKAREMTQRTGERILAALNTPYNLDGHLHYSSPSVGVAMFGAEGHSVTELLSRADLAMYHAKAAGKNTLRYFDPAMRLAANVRSQLEGAMRRGLGNDEFLLHYQPQIDGEGKLIGAEALVRWRHPQRGLLSPLEFIPLAEESGLIIPLGLQVLDIACRQLASWKNCYDLAGFALSVNVSARQIRQHDFVEQVVGVIERSGVDPKMLKLELTESLLVDNVEDTIAKMTALKKHGVGFSLDDFGTGYSSLSYLKRLPLDQLKIDKSFVSDVLVDQNDAAIAKMILALGRSLGLTVIAEGVETEEQQRFLVEHGCHAYQGYMYGKPMGAGNFESYLTKLVAKVAECKVIRLDGGRTRST